MRFDWICKRASKILQKPVTTLSILRIYRYQEETQALSDESGVSSCPDSSLRDNLLGHHFEAEELGLSIQVAGILNLLRRP